MASSGMLCRVARVGAVVSEERSASIIPLMIEALSSSETSVNTRATRRNIPKTRFFGDVIVSLGFQDHRTVRIPVHPRILLQIIFVFEEFRLLGC
jgi:hypothetical protein